MATQLKSDYQRGFGTETAPNWRDLAARDTHANPQTLLDENPPIPSDEHIPPSRYTSQEEHDAEVEKIWKKTWQVVGREEEIPNVGDHLVYNVAGLSFLIVRHAEDGIKAFYNVCRHRGRQLVDRSGAGAPHFRCAYHAWAFDLEGKLAFYPGAWDFPDVTAKQYGLREVQFDRWGGFMFINPDLDAAPLARHLGGLARHFETWPLDKRFSLYHIRKRIRANWKVSIEAFLEAYHLMQTHPQALPSVAEHATQYDIWDEESAQYSRSTTPCAVPSFHSKSGTPLGAIADMWALVNGLRRDEVDSLPEGVNDRASLAEWRRQALGEMTYADYSSCSDAMMLDSVQYWLFPNFCPWFGEGLPLSYVFRPDSTSPDSSYMDVWMLIRAPDNAPAPPAPAMIELGPDDKFEPHIGAMGEIFDQDDFNMPKVQDGMKTWPDDIHIVLGRYQESRIRFLHKAVQRRLKSA